MLLSTRSLLLPDCDASMRTRALVHRHYRAHLVENRGVVSEDLLFAPRFERAGPLLRPVLTVVLEGRARFRARDGSERWLQAGDLALLPSRDHALVRTEGERYRSVVLEWEPGAFGGRPAFEVGALARAAAESLELHARALSEEQDPERTAEHLASLWSLLRAQGAPLLPAASGDLFEALPEPQRALGRLLDRLLSDLTLRPGKVDLADGTGLSERQLSRSVSAFNARFGFQGAHWRDTLLRRRVLAGAALMTAAGARTERLSELLGYGSPAAFCRAMAQAGMPSPGSIARHVRGLR